MTEALHRAAMQLTAERARVKHRADIGHGEVVEDLVVAGLDIDFDFGEADDERVGRAFARVRIARHAHQTLTDEAGRRRLRHGVDVLGHLVAVELAAALDGGFGSLREGE